jgi:hypothetical protein
VGTQTVKDLFLLRRNKPARPASLPELQDRHNQRYDRDPQPSHGQEHGSYISAGAGLVQGSLKEFGSKPD